jgi:hypothetical protein
MTAKFSAEFQECTFSYSITRVIIFIVFMSLFHLYTDSYNPKPCCSFLTAPNDDDDDDYDDDNVVY